MTPPGEVLRAMGLHHNREHFMDPQHHSLIARVPPFWMRMMLLDHHAQPTSQLYHILGRRSKAQMKMCLTMGDKGRAYVIIPTLTAGIQALLIHFETHEDVMLPPHPLGDTTLDLLKYQGVIPLIPVFGAYFLSLAQFGLH